MWLHRVGITLLTLLKKSSGFLQSLIGFIQLTSQRNSLHFYMKEGFFIQRWQQLCFKTERKFLHIMTKNCGNVHPLIQMVDYKLPVIILICRVGYSIPLYSGFCVLFVSTLGNNYILEFYLVHVLAPVSNP